ncbi:MAG TPA: hypothetical protein VLH10_14865 [Yinghuangia sp.]|uniref:hypothetical protein n=1 Tax=Yinghuangia sp. YIM S10712 TaxID=3436930 RepID=UPI002D134779|nr:hypothetical protein [Yinghuangia sp.]
MATTAPPRYHDPVLDALEEAFQLDDIAAMRRHYMAIVWRMWRGNAHEAIQLRAKLTRYDGRLSRAWRAEIGYKVT